MTTSAEDLVSALIGPDRSRQVLYQQSAAFHFSIDLLAQMLPAWVDGLASEAHAADDEMQIRIKAAERVMPDADFLRSLGEKLAKPVTP